MSISETISDGLIDQADQTPPVSAEPAPLPRSGPPAVRQTSPILPAWLIKPDTRRDAARWAVQWSSYVVAFHLLRSPLYAGKALGCTPRGIGRLGVQLVRWLLDMDGRAVRLAAAVSGDKAAYLALSKERNNRVQLRLRALGWMGLLGAVVTLGLVVAAPWWLQAAAAVTVLALLAKAGQSADKPIITHAVVSADAPRMTPDVVVRALGGLGMSALTPSGKNTPAITFPAPVARDGKGWLAVIDLPHGVTWTEVLDRRQKLASGLRRPLGCVWPEGDATEHEGRLNLWVADRDPAKDVVRWALTGTTTPIDAFDGVPFGVDPRGRAVTLPLFQHNVLIGSQPGQGKTATVRAIACGAALDPTVEEWVHELKGSGDLDPLERIAGRFASGIDDGSIEYTAQSLKLLRTEVERRAAALKSLPRERRPDNMVTRELANDRELGLHMLLCIIDECQNLFGHPVYGAQAADDALFIIKIGRAFGVVLVLATQRPEKASLPTAISANVSLRWCLRVAGQVETDMILGTSSYQNGARPSLLRAGMDAGTGYLAGLRADPFVARSAYLDAEATAKAAEVGHQLRVRAGTLTGHAAGEEPQVAEDPRQVLFDILACWPAEQDWAWTETLADQLATLNTTYTGWTATDVGRALSRHSIPTRQFNRTVDGTRRNAKGVALAKVRAALEQED